MSNLLDKASIILTPTAYNNGEALCVKPSDGSGDFDFSRNSAATRVNAQGLVENVQILSSNLVQNGDFSEEGAEEVSNGSFTTNLNNWETSSWWVWDELGAYHPPTISHKPLYQQCCIIGKTYLITFDLNVVQGAAKASLGTNTGFTSQIFATNLGTGSYSYYVTAQAEYIIFNRNNSGIGSNNEYYLENVSVKEVGQNWIVGSDWSIAENKAVSSGSGNNLQQTINILSNKTYKLTFDVISTSGILAFDLGGATAKTLTDSGSKEYYFQSVNTNNLRFYGGNYYGSVTNISVIEITDDTNLPRINYEGFSYQDALGSEEITNGDFSSDSDWIKDINWTIANGVASSDGGTGFIRNSNTITTGKIYKWTYEITEYTSGQVKIFSGSGSDDDAYESSVGVFTRYFVANGNTPRLYSASFNGSIDNVSVKEYLGQEVVPDSGCGSWLFEPQSTNLITYSEDFSQSFWTKQASVTLDKGYLAPDGTYNATKISGVIGSSYVVSQGGILSSSSTKSIWAKTTSGTGVIHLGANQNQSNASFTVTNEWQRFEVTGTTTDVYAVDFRNASTTLSEVLVWGAQGENLSYATSYIPTNGEANGVTRNQDVCNNGGSLASINSTEGVLYAEIAALANDGTNRRIALSDGTQSNVIFIGYTPPSNYIQLYIAASGVSAVYINYLLNNALDFNKIAIRYKDDNFSAWVNGVQVDTDTSGNVPTTLSELTFDRGDGVFPFFGKTKALAVFPYLSDAELTELTTI